MTGSDTMQVLQDLREQIGEAAIERLSGLDRRTIQRAIAGQADIFPATMDRIIAGLAQASRSAGAAPTAGDARAVVDEVARRLPRTGQLAIRAALELWHLDGRRLSVADLSELLTGRREDSPTSAAVRNLAEAGLVEIDRPPSGRGLTVRWRGAD